MGDWLSILIQAGGAVTVCGMFIWFLVTRQKSEEEGRNVFLNHLAAKDKEHQEAANGFMEYLKSRDKQSRDIAMDGHEVLRSISGEVARLREEVMKQRGGG